MHALPIKIAQLSREARARAAQLQTGCQARAVAAAAAARQRIARLLMLGLPSF